MQKKVCMILTFFIILLGVYFLAPNEKEDTLFIEEGLEGASIESLLIKDFEKNEEVTVGQLLVFYSRLFGNNVSTYEEAKEFCVLKNIYLPSDLVYSTEEWEELWRDIVLGNTIFEKKGETYAINLINGYLTIYLNEQGYELIKKGMIPPQLYFYSPFSGIADLEEINLNKKATLGFVLDVLMSVDCEENKRAILHSIVSERILELTGKEEKDWTDAEIALYDYYSLSYYGEYIYLKDKGIIDEIELSKLSLPLSVSDFIVIANRIL